MTDHTQPQAVRVKPLVWVQNSRHKNSLWTGELAFETYYAIEPCGKVFRLMRGVFISEDGEDMPLEPTMETAKAAAQADYDARIMAAIEPAPDPRDAVIAQLQSDLSHMERQWSASQDLLAQSKELEFAFDEVATFRVVIAQLVEAGTRMSHKHQPSENDNLLARQMKMVALAKWNAALAAAKAVM